MSKYQEIRAVFDKETITVYQAYNKAIATKATINNKFVNPFSFTRMTWIKPSFLWMMERSNWGTKSNQEHILAIKIKRNYWEKALSLAVLTHPDLRVYVNEDDWRNKFSKSPIHIQWDPERSIRGGKLEFRSIQVGISRHLINEFNEIWISEIKEITPFVSKLRDMLKKGKHSEAQKLLPQEKVYQVSEGIKAKIGIV